MWSRVGPASAVDGVAMGRRSSADERIKTKLKARLLSWRDSLPEADRVHANGDALEQQLRQLLQDLPQDEYRSLQIARDGEEARFLREILYELIGVGPLEKLLSDATISEIMVNGPEEIFVERNGRLERTEMTFQDTAHLMAVIERLLSSAGVAVNEATPLCDASLADGTRINVILPPLAMNGPVMTIRRSLPEWTMEQYLTRDTLSQQAAEFLEACVKARVNLVISGGTSTGKTTLLSILSSYIPQGERVITIENVAELELPKRDHWIRLVARTPNIAGQGEVPLRSLVRNALRMRPDRILLGEARGGEALDVVQAMHIGHEGVITVLHANSPQAALERLETLMLMSGLELNQAACRTQIATALDLVIHVARYADGSRRVSSIAQVLGSSSAGFGLEEVFTFDMTGFKSTGELEGELRYTGVRPKFLQKFLLNHVAVPAWVATA